MKLLRLVIPLLLAVFLVSIGITPEHEQPADTEDTITQNLDQELDVDAPLLNWGEQGFIDISQSPDIQTHTPEYIGNNQAEVLLGNSAYFDDTIQNYVKFVYLDIYKPRLLIA